MLDSRVHLLSICKHRLLPDYSWTVQQYVLLDWEEIVHVNIHCIHMYVQLSSQINERVLYMLVCKQCDLISSG